MSDSYRRWVCAALSSRGCSAARLECGGPACAVATSCAEVSQRPVERAWLHPRTRKHAPASRHTNPISDGSGWIQAPACGRQARRPAPPARVTQMVMHARSCLCAAHQ
eukprot:363186-Chlamydomonas_euryale.AAC.4